MSRTLTATSVASIFAQETDEVYLALITITHATLAQPIRVSSDAIDTTSRGNLFVSYPFNIILPTDEEGSPPRAQVVIDNVERTIAETLRRINSPASFLIEVVRAKAPDTVEASFDQFRLSNVRGDVFTISGELSIEDMLTEPFPYRTFTPAEFRGLFR